MLKKILYILCLSMATGYASGILPEPDASQPESWGSTFQKLCTVPKTFVQSLYMTKDEIVLGKVTTAEKVKNGVHDLAQAAKTFDPTPLVDPVGVAAQNLADAVLDGVTSFHNMSTGGKFLVVGTVGLAVLQTVNAATVAAGGDTVTHYRFEKSLRDICDSQKFDFGRLHCSSVGHYESGVCQYTIKCTLSSSFETTDIIALPPIPSIIIDASSNTGYFPLGMEWNCDAIAESLKSFNTAGVEYDAFYSSNRAEVFNDCLIPLSHGGMCTMVYQGSGMHSLYLEKRCAPYQGTNCDHYSVIGRLPPVVYHNGTSIYKFMKTNSVQQCVSRGQPETCIDLYSTTPALVVEVGGVKALYPYQGDLSAFNNQGYFHALWGPGSRNSRGSLPRDSDWQLTDDSKKRFDIVQK